MRLYSFRTNDPHGFEGVYMLLHDRSNLGLPLLFVFCFSIVTVVSLTALAEGKLVKLLGFWREALDYLELCNILHTPLHFLCMCDCI